MKDLRNELPTIKECLVALLISGYLTWRAHGWLFFSNNGYTSPLWMTFMVTVQWVAGILLTGGIIIATGNVITYRYRYRKWLLENEDYKN